MNRFYENHTGEAIIKGIKNKSMTSTEFNFKLEGSVVLSRKINYSILMTPKVQGVQTSIFTGYMSIETL